MKRFTFKGEVDAETIDHAMLSIAHDLLKTKTELEADESGEVGTVVSITIKPKRAS